MDDTKPQPALRLVPGCGGAASGGYKSGRKAHRDTPVTRSISNTCAAGGLPAASQYDTVPCALPNARARALCPPTALHASSNAALLMLGINGSSGHNVNDTAVSTFAHTTQMSRKKIHKPSEFWQRLEEAIGHQYADFNPTSLARALGMSQGTIHPWYLGTGLPSMEKAIELARKGGVNVEWLVLGYKPKHPIARDPQMRDMVEVCEQLHPERQAIVLHVARNELLAQQIQDAEIQRVTGTHRT